MDPTIPLKRKSSRWQVLPTTEEEKAGEIEDANDKYSLLLFLRDLDAGPDSWNDFINGLRNAPGSIDDKSTIAALLAAALDTKMVDHDYFDPDQPAGKKRRIGLFANEDGRHQIEELDALVRIARTVWPDRDQVNNYLGRAYQENLRPLAEGNRHRYPLDSIFDFARSWSEIRYRFMNHALRDDPALHARYSSGRARTKGDGANTMVHESNMLLDAQMVEFQHVRGTGYTAQDRDIFEELYRMTPEEGRALVRYTGPNTGLRIGLPQVFRYATGLLNAYVDWRVRVLESHRRQVLAGQAYRAAGTRAAKDRVRADANQQVAAHTAPVDAEYAGFVAALRALIAEAAQHNAFRRPSYDALGAAAARLASAVKASPLNRGTPELSHNMAFQNQVRGFPGLQTTLIRPTGAAIIPVPRRNPR